MTSLDLFGAALALYGCGAAAGLAVLAGGRGARRLAFGLALLGSVLLGGSSLFTLSQGGEQAAALASGLPLLEYALRLDPLAALFNLALTAFVTSSVAARFVFPQVSLEGRAWWVLRTAPVPLGTIWWSKFTTAYLPLVLLGEALVVVTNRALGADRSSA